MLFSSSNQTMSQPQHTIIAKDCVEIIHKSPELAKHEGHLQKQPFDMSAWVLYLDAVDEDLTKKDNSATAFWTLRDWIGRRALALLPRSYKLWKIHWEFIRKGCQEHVFTTSNVLECFERCLWTLSAYPRVWVEYLSFVKDHPGCTTVTVVRQLMNRALQSLPVTQHDKIWPTFLEWIQSSGTNTAQSESTGSREELVPQWNIPLETQIRLLRRYCMFNPLYRKEFAEFLTQEEQWGEAAVQYQLLLNSTPASSSSRDGYWQAFSELCTQHPDIVEEAGVPWEKILRSVLKEKSKSSRNNQKSAEASNSTLLEGLLWTQLADSWIRRGSFDIARSVYEEGLQTVSTVRDFSVLYDAYLQFEEGLLEAATSALEGDEEMEEDEAMNQDGDDADWDILLEETASSKLADMELAVARAEHLTSRRPLLLNAVVLRQEPHSVKAWVERADLYLELELHDQAIAALQEALKTVDANRAGNGTPCEIVIKLVSIYEELNRLDDAQSLLDRICRNLEYKFQKSFDLAECWAAWIELSLRQELWDEALSLARQSIAPGKGPKRLNLTKSVRLWDLLLDLEEALGTVQTTKDAYNRAIEIKAATVRHILQYASFLTQREYFEESFTAFEKGIELFAFPHAGAKVLWKAYVQAFVHRYKGSKVERTRDIFQRCLEDCPEDICSEFFLLNGKYEESYGLVKRALSVYQAMCQKVQPTEKFLAHKLWITKTTKYLGLTATRDMYQEAIDTLKDSDAAKICMDFAKMETQLQEIERARAILSYGAQMADPRRLPEYWKAWNEFEISNGNEETFREMLRIKRSVEAAFSTINFNATGLNEKVDNLTDEQALKMIATQEGVDEDEMKKVQGFVPSSSQTDGSKKRTAAAANLEDVEARVAQLRKVTADQNAAAQDEQQADDNDEEIDIDDIDAEIEEAAATGHLSNEESENQENVESSLTGLQTKAIPQAVFGGLAKT